MKTALPVDHELGRLLGDAALGGSSGILSALRGKHKRLFCLVEGQIVHAASNVIEEQFSEALIQDRIVSVGDIAGAQRQSAQQGVSLSGLLVESGLLPREALLPALESHTRKLLFATLDWHASGEVAFTPGTPDLGDEVRVSIAVVPLLLDYAGHYPEDVAALKARMDFLDLPLVVKPERRALLDDLPADGVARTLLDDCDGQATALDLAQRHPREGDGTWRALYGLWLLALVEPASGAAAAAAERLTRHDILQRLERVENADYYSVLEIGASASHSKVREAYYELARQYHPDRFRSGPLMDLRERVESYFARVTEAYNTLGDPGLRAAYDELLSEREAATTQQDTTFLARQNFRRAHELVARGRLNDAVTSIENAIKLDPRNATYRLEAGRLLGRNPRLRGQAEAHLREATRLDPSLVDAYEELAELHAKSGRHPEAAALFREVLRWDPTHARARRRLSEVGG